MNYIPIRCPICDVILNSFISETNNQKTMWCGNEETLADEYYITLNQLGNLIYLQYCLEDFAVVITPTTTYIRNQLHDDILVLKYVVPLESFEPDYILKRIQFLLTYS